MSYRHRKIIHAPHHALCHRGFVHWQAYSSDDIRDMKQNYPKRKYNELYLERMHCRKHCGTPFPFLNLPTELRLKTYRYVLVLGEPIELWPHIGLNMRCHVNFERRLNFRQYTKNVHPLLGLLRVCRLVHSEASEVFYGENAFRFSGINGWMSLSAWLFTIGPSHSQFLTNLTVHVPFPGRDHLLYPKKHSRGWEERTCRLNPYQFSHFKHAMCKTGFKIPIPWSHDWSIKWAIKQLAQSKLRIFRVALPSSYYIDHRKESSNAWYWYQLNQLKRQVDQRREAENCHPLRFGFLFLKHRRITRAEDIDTVQSPEFHRYTGECRRLIKLLSNKGWIQSVEYASPTIRGRYSIIGKEEYRRRVGSREFLKESRVEEYWQGITE